MKVYSLTLTWLACGLPSINAYGCSNCLGIKNDFIYGGCTFLMTKMFNPSTVELGVGKNICREFVQVDRCCTSSCSASPQTCMNTPVPTDESTLKQLEVIKRNPALLDVRSLLLGEPPYHLIRETKDLQALHPRAFQGWHVEGSFSEVGRDLSLEERGVGQACCIAVKTTMLAGFGQLAPYAATMEWTDSNTAGVILIAAAAAGAAACNKAFGVMCAGYVAGSF